MKLIECLNENNVQMSRRLAEILAITIKKVDNDFYQGLIYEGKSDEQIGYHVANIDWDKEDFIKIIKMASRLVDIWNFS